MNTHIEPCPELLEFWDSMSYAEVAEYIKAYYKGRPQLQRAMNFICSAPDEQVDELIKYLEANNTKLG